MDLNGKISEFLNQEPYNYNVEEHPDLLLNIFRDSILNATAHHSGYDNFIKQSPIDIFTAERICDLPYLPVRMFKAENPISLISPDEIKNTLTSSSTSGQAPSRIVLDSITSRRMSKGVSNIMSNFIGKRRRPYLVVDIPESVKSTNGAMGARGAAIRGLQPFASSIDFCLRKNPDGNIELDMNVLNTFKEKYSDEPVLIYGFTYIIWLYFYKALEAINIRFNFSNAYVIHSGGWKKLEQQSVSKKDYNKNISNIFGIEPDRVIDFYGMVENLGIVYPDCSEGNKHVPTFGHVIIRSPLTFEPVEIGEIGIVQVCSILPNSFPGHLLLTEDLAKLISNDDCPCGRRGIAFRFAGRIPKAEIRGCGNTHSKRN